MKLKNNLSNENWLFFQKQNFPLNSVETETYCVLRTDSGLYDIQCSNQDYCVHPPLRD